MAQQALRKPNNVIAVPVGKDGFFKWWCVFIRPFVKMTDREADVLAEFLRQRQELSKEVSDPGLLDELVMGEAVKKKVIKACGITLKHFYVVMSNLRKNKVFLGDVINPRLVPNVRVDDNGVFQLLVLFKEGK